MAQIQVTGCILNDLEPKTGQSGRPYVSFGLLETTGYGKSRWTQVYQVWVWGKEDVDRLMKSGVGKGCTVWLTGKLRLVDAYTKKDGQTKQLKVAYEDCRLLADSEEMQHTHNPAASFSRKELDGDREPLPE